MEGGEAREKKWAKAIWPVRKYGNLLLTTLLLGNTLVNAVLATLMAEFTDSFRGVALTTSMVFIFGELIPQSVCTRFGLLIGASTVWLTKFWILVLFPVAWPISTLLDAFLGNEVGTMYSTDELKRLVAIHVTDPQANAESGLTLEDQRMISGVLDYKDKQVTDVMTSIEKVFMLEKSVRLNFENLLEVYKSGYTRIPVYESTRQNVVGILFTKDLILIDPDDEIEVSAVLSFHGKMMKRILDSTPLHEVFKMFKSSNTHMMIAVHMPATTDFINAGGTPTVNYSLQAEMKVTGIITLEDVLEEVIKAEIVDETDNYESNLHDKKVSKYNKRNVHRFFNLFSHRIRDQSQLTDVEFKAVSAYLTLNVPEFKSFNAEGNEDSMRLLLVRSEIIDTFYKEQLNPYGSQASGTAKEPRQQILYKAGIQSDSFSVILQGKVIVEAGKEKFMTQIHPWMTLGNRALSLPQQSPYMPDFTASTSGQCRILRINRHDYHAVRFPTRTTPLSKIKTKAHANGDSARSPLRSSAPRSSPRSSEERDRGIGRQGGAGAAPAEEEWWDAGPEQGLQGVQVTFADDRFGSAAHSPRGRHAVRELSGAASSSSSQGTGSVRSSRSNSLQSDSTHPSEEGPCIGSENIDLEHGEMHRDRRRRTDSGGLEERPR